MKLIAIQGEKGSFSENAAKSYFGNNIKISTSFSFSDVFHKVKYKKVNYGIVPIENSLYGSVIDSLDLLQKNSLYIVGEINLQISHFLISNKKYKLSQVKKIYSHPQALGQCSKFLDSIPQVKIIPNYDTAGSAKMLNKYQDEFSAAIASREAAKIYGLKIVRSNIQNKKKNYTRFLIIAQSPHRGKLNNPKTSVCIELKSIPGALFKALSVFALRDIDLVKIESRPIPDKPFQYLFYIDFVGDLKDGKIKLAINHLKEISSEIKSFGTYETGKFISK
ncbi:MAG: prephenate dehydratase [Bacteroidetes bacterium]|nr:prephenate dehydratase [Bacteroidota bacterium]